MKCKSCLCRSLRYCAPNVAEAFENEKPLLLFKNNRHKRKYFGAFFHLSMIEMRVRRNYILGLPSNGLFLPRDFEDDDYLYQISLSEKEIGEVIEMVYHDYQSRKRYLLNRRQEYRGDEVLHGASARIYLDAGSMVLLNDKHLPLLRELMDEGKEVGIYLTLSLADEDKRDFSFSLLFPRYRHLEDIPYYHKAF